VQRYVVEEETWVGVIELLLSKESLTAGEIANHVEGNAYDAIAVLWSEGLVEVEGNPAILPGPLDLPREFVRRWGPVIPARAVEEAGLAGKIRLQPFVERRTGETLYYVFIRGDDRVRLSPLMREVVKLGSVKKISRLESEVDIIVSCEAVTAEKLRRLASFARRYGFRFDFEIEAEDGKLLLNLYFLFPRGGE